MEGRELPDDLPRAGDAARPAVSQDLDVTLPDDVGIAGRTSLSEDGLARIVALDAGRGVDPPEGRRR